MADVEIQGDMRRPDGVDEPLGPLRCIYRRTNMRLDAHDHTALGCMISQFTQSVYQLVLVCLEIRRTASTAGVQRRDRLVRQGQLDAEVDGVSKPGHGNVRLRLIITNDRLVSNHGRQFEIMRHHQGLEMRAV